MVDNETDTSCPSFRAAFPTPEYSSSNLQAPEFKAGTWTNGEAFRLNRCKAQQAPRLQDQRESTQAQQNQFKYKQTSCKLKHLEHTSKRT
eukprot:624578-Pelagomonas_calceolata.AAC.1